MFEILSEFEQAALNEIAAPEGCFELSAGWGGVLRED